MEWETDMEQLLHWHWRFQMMLISTECILSKGILPVAGRTQNYNLINSYSICPFLTEFAESGSALWLVAGGWSRCGSGNKNDDIRANVAKTPPNVNPQH